MKSIRLSLIVYFLLLLAAALGAVSVFVYQTSSHTLKAKEKSTRNLLEALYEAECKNLKLALDQRLVRQAQTLAGLARSSHPHIESILPLGALGAGLLPEGHLTLPLWFAEGMHPPLAFRIYRQQPMQIHIESAEDVLPSHEEGKQDFFQTFSTTGRPLERSRSMGDIKLALDDDVRQKAELLREYFDDVELKPGLRVRRITLKATVPRFRTSSIPQIWRLSPPFGKNSRWLKAPPPGPPPGPPGRGNFEGPVIFIQYASETAPMEATMATLLDKLKTDLVAQETETRVALASLRTRLGWIGLMTFVAIVAGGYWLVRLGLAPLQRLSDAVSRVSVKDFRLQVDESRLPGELRPIASRITQTLEQLERAFAREKQAAADISHELRTPLAALLTTLEVALRKQRRPEEYEEILEECRASGKQMTQLVERLLALARLDAGGDTMRFREVDVANLALQCADLVRPLADARGLDVRIHAAEPATIKADPDKLREVLTNLLHNAIEYNRPNGSVDLAVERHNGQLCLEVRDTGIGIPAEATEHIFERFYRADPSRHADTLHAGIGLAIVKGYVDLMGGTIGVESSSAGSTFRVRFPAR